MSNQRNQAETSWLRIKELVADAFEHPEGERRGFIEHACGKDTELLSEVESLVFSTASRRSPASSPEFLEVPATALMDVAAPKVGAIVGGYELRAVIGEGGMGRVYEAHQQSPARRVALKVLRPGFLAADSERRFGWEVEALAKLNHPCIATVHGAGVHRDAEGRSVPWFAMEFIEGTSMLGAADQARLSRADRLKLILQVAGAVAHAHARGVIHRDLKPDNILVDEAGRPHVLDFGIARSMDPLATAMTTSGEIIGTVGYMSPEQFRGDSAEVDARCDVYALGVLLYRLLTGEAPISLAGVSLPEAALRMSQENATPAGRHDRSLRGDLETILGKALERDPDRRYPTVDALGADVRRFLAQEPISARPPTATYQLTQFARRHRGLVAVSTLALCALIAAVVGTSIGLVRAESARATAVAERDRATEATDFLGRILAGADPRNDGRDVRVLDLLRSASMELGVAMEWSESAQDQSFTVSSSVIQSAASLSPSVRASMHQALGDSYRKLQEFGPAVVHLEFAIEAFTELDGPLSMGTLEAEGALAEIDLEAGRLEDAEKRITRLHEGAASLGVETPTWLKLRPLELETILADRLGDQELRLAKAQLAFDAWLAVEPEGSDQTEVARTELVNALIAQRRDGEAEALLNDGIQASASMFGPQHPRLFVHRSNRILLLVNAGRYAEALGRVEALLPETLKSWGDRHHNTVALLGHYATALEGLGRLTEAIEVRERALAASVASLGESHAGTRIARNNLGVALMYAEEFQRAQTVLSRCLAEVSEQEEEHDPVSVLQLEMNLAAAFEHTGREDEAAGMHQRVLRRLTEIAGEAHPQTLIARNNLAVLQMKRGLAEEGVELGLFNLRLAREHQPGHRMNVFPLQSNLGRLYSAMERFDEAEIELLAVESSLRSDDETTPRETARVRELLREMYRAWGKDDEALAWKPL